MSRRLPGRPRSICAIDSAALESALAVRYAGRKRALVYECLAKQFHCSERSIRYAFGGKCTDSVREKLEAHFGLEPCSLSLSQWSVDKLLLRVKNEVSNLEEHVRHHTEAAFRDHKTAMISLTPVLEALVGCTGTSDLEHEDKLFVLDAIEWNVAYRHLVEDSVENERSIARLVYPALPAAIGLLNHANLSDVCRAKANAVVGELFHNWVLPKGDVWKRDVVSPELAREDAAWHDKAAPWFREAAQLSTDNHERARYHWRYFIEIECQARIFCKAKMVEQAQALLVRLRETCAELASDTSVQGDLLVVEAMLAKAMNKPKLAVEHALNARDLYAEQLGFDHHLPHSLLLYALSCKSAAVGKKGFNASLEFFKASALRTHWIIDMNHVVAPLLR